MNDSLLHTILLAQGIGLYLVITAIIMIARAHYYQELLTHLKAGSSTITLAASIGLMISLAIVLVHNIWIWGPDVLITIIGWLLLIKSILWLSLPNYMAHCSQKIYAGWSYYLVSIIAGMVGVLLMAHGFYPHMGTGFNF